MDAEDTLSVLLLCVAGVAFISFLILLKRWRAANASRTEELVVKAPTATLVAPPTAAKADDADDVSVSPGPISVVCVSAPRVESATIAKLDYEEDDAIDPTRVGAKSSAAAVATDKQKESRQQPPMKQIIYDEDAGVDEPTHVESLFLVSATAQTDPGKRRKRNEDSVLMYNRANLFVVADGMGGYSGGAIASQLAVKTIHETFERRDFAGAESTRPDIPREARELACAMQRANEAILEVASRDKALEGMGTTLCAARFSPNKKRLYIGHVGDSRCYRLRDGVFQQMTADHTMRDLGATGPDSDQLSRAVGIWPAVPIDLLMASPTPGDVYLLCSDGLTKMLSDETICAVLDNEEDPKEAVERLVLFANARGGKDNITVILVRVVTPHWKARTSDESITGVTVAGGDRNDETLQITA